MYRNSDLVKQTTFSFLLPSKITNSANAAAVLLLRCLGILCRTGIWDLKKHRFFFLNASPSEKSGLGYL